MGKHNGKARSAGSGAKVGSALLNSQSNSKKQEWAAYRHTTSLTKDTGMQSVIEQNDLSELMSMAELAGRDFAGVRGEAVIIAPGGPTAKDMEMSAAERHAAQERSAHKLAIPRRPHWTRDMTAEQIQQQEQTMFLSWRRNLAWLEDEEHLVLTPFEKNLEVWRQLWRVVERSDILVQVVDARDPLCYRSEDLEDYTKSVHANTECLLLLNKADLLPEALRIKWADYFDSKGVKYVFWSAYQAIQRQKVEKTAAAQALGTKVQRDEPSTDPRVNVLDEEGLLEVFSTLARDTLEAAGSLDPRNDPNNKHTPTVGLVGYPNVGKSSTINALFGSKKTAVAPTPGKTKHFQTLYITPNLLLCDCPGLVFPKFATSKGSMVAAGVIPIDRLTEMHAPTAVVAHRISRQQLFAKFSIAMPRPKLHEDSDRDPTAVELLAAYARSRAWVNGSGLPDETRAGRQLLKDYTSGKVVYCEWPPGTERPCPYDDGLQTYTGDKSLLMFAEDMAPSTSGQQNVNKLNAEDVRDMKVMDIPVAAEKDKPSRPSYKFHKKPPKDNSRNMRKVKAGECPYGSFDVV